MADTAATLLDRLLRKELPVREFLHLADELPDEELERLLALLRQQAQKAKAVNQM